MTGTHFASGKRYHQVSRLCTTESALESDEDFEFIQRVDEVAAHDASLTSDITTVTGSAITFVTTPGVISLGIELLLNELCIVSSPSVNIITCRGEFVFNNL